MVNGYQLMMFLKISTEQIISMMVGRDLTERFPKKTIQLRKWY